MDQQQAPRKTPAVAYFWLALGILNLLACWFAYFLLFTLLVVAFASFPTFLTLLQDLVTQYPDSEWFIRFAPLAAFIFGAAAYIRASVGVYHFFDAIDEPITRNIRRLRGKDVNAPRDFMRVPLCKFSDRQESD